MIKLLIGGSPCTYWSIAQKNGRETEAEGMGWELFKNYLIAKKKFKPDFFLYENNKSAAQAIKDQIKHELGVWDETLYTEDSGTRYIEINSALVSAQNRQRFYVHNCGEVEQPEDRGILLRDILETTSCGFGETDQGKAYCLTARYYKGVGTAPNKVLEKSRDTMVAEPCCLRMVRTDEGKALRKQYEAGEIRHGFNEHRRPEPRTDGKTNTISTVQKDNMIIEPVNVTANGKSQTIKAQYHKNSVANFCCYNSTYGATSVAEPVRIGAKDKPIYEVKDGLITIKGKQYPIKLVDGYYIIRKLTVTECCRLQTMPGDYCRAVSNSQAYKGLGNGWTAEVIIHILNGALKDVPRDEEIVVLSMYVGIGTGRYCLDKMGFTNVKYYAYEIDRYAKQIAMSNYPDIIQCGDAFAVRDDDWEKTFAELREKEVIK